MYIAVLLPEYKVRLRTMNPSISRCSLYMLCNELVSGVGDVGKVAADPEEKSSHQTMISNRGKGKFCGKFVLT